MILNGAIVVSAGDRIEIASPRRVPVSSVFDCNQNDGALAVAI
jgi:hypothetical protein